MAKVMICTITHNREELLPRAIESILTQTYTDFRYLIIENGCTDGTTAILEHYQQQDCRIEIHKRVKNKLDVALTDYINEILFADESCEYFMILDDDDYCMPKTVEKLIDLIEEHEADISVIGSKYVDEKGNLSNKYIFEGVYEFNKIDGMIELLKREKFNSGRGGKMYKKEMLEIELPNVSRVRDIHREYRVIANIRKIVVTGEPYYYVYRHSTNISGLNNKEQITPYKMREHLEANRLRTEWISDNYKELKYYIHYCEMSFMISLYNRIGDLQVEDCYEIREEMFSYIQSNYVEELYGQFLSDVERVFVDNLSGEYIERVGESKWK